MPNYYIVPIISGTAPLFGVGPDIPVGINFEAKSYDIVNNTCKIKTLRNEIIASGTQITEQQYLEN